MNDYSYFSEDYFNCGSKCGTAYSDYVERSRVSPVYKSIATTLNRIFKPRSSLEIGCACGIVVKHLNELGVDAHGIDVSDWAIANKEHENVRLASADNLPYVDMQFDLVYSVHAIEHIPQNMSITSFKEIRRVTKLVQLHLLPLVGTYPYDGDKIKVLAGLRKDVSHHLLNDKEWWLTMLAGNDFVPMNHRVLWPYDNNELELANCQIALTRREMFKIDEYNKNIDESNIEILNKSQKKWGEDCQQIKALTEQIETHPILNNDSDSHFAELFSIKLELSPIWCDLTIFGEKPFDFSGCLFTIMVDIIGKSADLTECRLALTSGEGNINVTEIWFKLRRGLNTLEFTPEKFINLSGQLNISSIERILFGGTGNASVSLLLFVKPLGGVNRLILGWR
jgi:SAM-dependent methyltransferase